MTNNSSSHSLWLLEQLSRIKGAKSLSRANALTFAKRLQEDASMPECQAWINFVFTEYGLQMQPWSEQPREEVLPMLALIPGKGACLVYGGTKEDGWLVDSVEGRQTVKRFVEGAIFIPVRAHVLSKQDRTAGSLLRAVFFEKKHWLAFATLATILGNLLALAVSLYSMQVYDRVIPTNGVSTLIVLTTAAAFAICLDLLLKLARSTIVNASLNGIDEKLSHGLFARLLRIRMDQFPPNVGSLASQLRGYETIRGFVSTLTLYLIADAPFALLFLVGIYFIGGAQLAGVVVIFLLLSLVSGLLFRRRIETAAHSGIGLGNRKHGMLIEAVEGAELIKANSASWQFQARWNAVSQNAIEHDGKVRKLSEMASYLGGAIQQASYIGLIACGAYVAGEANLTTGALVACSILSGRVLAPIGMLPGLLVQSGHSKAALKNLNAVFGLHSDNHDVLSPMIPDSISGRYNLRNVSFGYTPEIKSLTIPNLDIAAGEKIAILGTVGAGKSTLLRVLSGLYKPQEGQVLLDGLELQQISRQRLCDDLGYLPQQISLFSGTLRDNLLLGTPGCSDEKLLQVSRETGLLDLIGRHPKGFDLPIAEGGAGLSGGQRQLVSLTRLLLAEPALWLLDEPTASMDAATEERCLTALGSAMQDKHTVVIVTHKPALLGLVNRIIVMTPDGISLDGPRDLVLNHLKGNTRQLTTVKTETTEASLSAQNGSQRRI